MIVISAFNPEAMLSEPDSLHKDEPFDGIDIVKVFPGERVNDRNDEVSAFVEEYMDSHPGHKLVIDSFTVTL